MQGWRAIECRFLNSSPSNSSSAPTLSSRLTKRGFLIILCALAALREIFFLKMERRDLGLWEILQRGKSSTIGDNHPSLAGIMKFAVSLQNEWLRSNDNIELDPIGT